MTIAWVTGARGFIGRHVAKKLAQNGIKVAGIDHIAWPDAEAAQWGLSYYLLGDVSSINLQQLARNAGTPDQIFHLAGGSSVALSIQTPEKDFKMSVESSVQMLEWVRNYAPEAHLVLSSSAAVYGNKYSKPINESDSEDPYSPYGYHKLMAELLFKSYSKNFRLHTAIVRLFSVYGPELRKQLLWDLCTRLSNTPDEITLSGSGQERRDWLHVQDAAEYMIKSSLFANPDAFVVNGGSGHVATVKEIAELVCNAWGIDTQITFNGNVRPGDPQCLIADIRFGQSTGLAPKIDLQSGIQEYVAWFQHCKRN